MTLRRLNFIREDLSELVSTINIESLSSLRNSSVVITGGAGFVGTWVASLLLFLNETKNFKTKITVIDRDIEKLRLIAPHIASAPEVSIQRADVRYLVELPRLSDYVLHAAGQPSSHDHISNPVEVMSGIALGTEAVLRAAERLTNLKMVVSLSSSLVYGISLRHSDTLSEADLGVVDTASASSIYAEAKRYSEFMAHAFRNQYRLPISILRPFTFIGPYQSLQSPWALNNFIRDALSGHPIKVLGDGSTLRSFMYGSDVASWILHALAGSTSGETFNLGSPESISLKELAFIVQNEQQVKPPIEFCMGSESLIKTSIMVPNTKKIQERLGVKLTVPLQKSIARTIRWHQLENESNNIKL